MHIYIYICNACLFIFVHVFAASPAHIMESGGAAAADARPP